MWNAIKNIANIKTSVGVEPLNIRIAVIGKIVVVVVDTSSERRIEHWSIAGIRQSNTQLRSKVLTAVNLTIRLVHLLQGLAELRINAQLPLALIRTGIHGPH